MQKGTIARVTDRGFGFISQEGSDRDVFFHANELKNVSFDELREGDAVTFELADGPKGPNAVNVNRVEGGAAPAAAPMSDDASGDMSDDADNASDDMSEESAE